MEPSPSPGRDRRGPRRPQHQRRPISPRSRLEGRQLWRIGDWGGASEQIGRRWEVLGADRLDELIGHDRPGLDGEPYMPRSALVLHREPELAAQVQAAGKTHADALLLGTMGGRSVVEPVDFKWTLETANPKQVGADVLIEMLQDPPSLFAARLAAGLADLRVSGEPLYLDGFFLAPEHAENIAALAPQGPLDPSWTVLAPVDPIEFFEPLVGWDVALALARSEGALIADVEQAERYYRLGAGTLGALKRLAAGIFGDVQGDLDGPSEVANLRAERRVYAIGDLIAYLDRALTARSQLVDRLKAVERDAYPWGRFREDLARRRVDPEQLGDRSWARLYGSLMASVGERMRTEGKDLVAAGADERTALNEIGRQATRWTRLARGMLDQRLGPERADSDAPPGDDTPSSGD